MRKQVARLLHSGLVVAALLPLSPLAPEVAPAFSSWFATNQAGSNGASVSLSVSTSSENQPLDQFGLLWTADGPIGPVGLPQTRSGGGTR